MSFARNARCFPTCYEDHHDQACRCSASLPASPSLASSHSGRRTFASRLLAAGESLETVQALLGHADLDHVMPYLEVSEDTLREMFEVVL